MSAPPTEGSEAPAPRGVGRSHIGKGTRPSRPASKAVGDPTHPRGSLRSRLHGDVALLALRGECRLRRQRGAKLPLRVGWVALISGRARALPAPPAKLSGTPPIREARCARACIATSPYSR